jgi:hypothetical protein
VIARKVGDQRSVWMMAGYATGVTEMATPKSGESLGAAEDESPARWGHPWPTAAGPRNRRVLSRGWDETGCLLTYPATCRARVRRGVSD